MMPKILSRYKTFIESLVTLKEKKKKTSLQSYGNNDQQHCYSMQQHMEWSTWVISLENVWCEIWSERKIPFYSIVFQTNPRLPCAMGIVHNKLCLLLSCISFQLAYCVILFFMIIFSVLLKIYLQFFCFVIT